MSKKRAPINLRRIGINALIIMLILLLVGGILGLLTRGVLSVVGLLSSEEKSEHIQQTEPDILGSLPFGTMKSPSKEDSDDE